MATATGPRKSVSIYDYPEHLNPFREDDNHNKIRFWTLGRKLNRTNSISFSGIKDLKNSWALRSFMKKGKKDQTPAPERKTSQVNGDSSPIVYRRAMQYSSSSTGISPAQATVGSPERPDRYVYGGSVTPLPRSRFQQRLRSPSHCEVNSYSDASPRMARSEISDSRFSVESTNPFDEGPVPPVRASRRKKKRTAPLPPGSADVSTNSVGLENKTISEQENITTNDLKEDLETEELALNIELKIVEDENDVVQTSSETALQVETTKPLEVITHMAEDTVESTSQLNDSVSDRINETVDDVDQALKKSDSDEDILDKVSFPKVDINKYRRNSSLNEDDIRLRRGNLEDYHVVNKRSKSLNNDLNLTYVSYDINLKDDTRNDDKDPNGNETPKKVICKLYDDNSRKHSLDNSISSTEKEFIEIDRATRELEREISKLNSALIEDDSLCVGTRLSVSDIRRKFDNNNVSTPNPIPKPRRSHYGSSSPINGNVP